MNVGDVITVTVGRGGTGSTFKINMDAQDAEPGQRSSFGSLVVADGGHIMNGRTGGDGGSGGGAAGVQSKCGDGGTGGKDGATGSNGDAKGGKGQGDYSSLLSGFKFATFTAGSGGKGGDNCGGGGGGGGGVLMNGHGPAAIGLDKCAFGGKGFGASGAGAFDDIEKGTSPSTYHNEGGSGADGLVYVEW